MSMVCPADISEIRILNINGKCCNYSFYIKSGKFFVTLIEDYKKGDVLNLALYYKINNIAKYCFATVTLDE